MPDSTHNKDHTKILESVKLSKLIVPMVLGLGVVFYMIYKQLDLEALSDINWQWNTVWWVGMAIFMYIIRHIFYSFRLQIMSSGAFSFLKAMQLIVIWEFASAVSPTSVGGSGVALILLAQEKLSGAKTVSIVLYSLVLDTLFFVLSLILLYVMLGPIMIRPGMDTLATMDGYGLTFLTVLGIMILYGGVIFYGLFINPRIIQRILIGLSNWKILGKFKNSLHKTADDIVISSHELHDKPWSFHIGAFVTTSLAWVTRFLAINFLILGLVTMAKTGIYHQLLQYARAEAMYVITAFSPTPGGAGIAEFLFGGFFSDYIPKGVASLIALIWRLISYYPYLILGAIVIPVWIRHIIASHHHEPK